MSSLRHLLAGCVAVVLLAGCTSQGVCAPAVPGDGARLAVQPAIARVPPSGVQPFTVTLVGLADQPVTWSVAEGPSGGTVTTDGVYSAPSSPGTYHVVALASTDGASTQATVTVGPLTQATGLASTTPAAVAAELFVAIGGSDANPGSASRPFATLEGARAAVSALKAGAGLPAGGVAVTVRGGTYPRTATFELSGDDSGAQGAPVIYRAYPGETVRLVGGKVLPGQLFTPVGSDDPAWPRLDARAQGGGGQVWKVNLRDARIGVTDFGTLRPRGFGASADAALELFFNGSPMPLARWPDPGETDAAGGVDRGMAVVPSAGDQASVPYQGTRPTRWGAALAAHDVWLHTYTNTWADIHVPVVSAAGGIFALDPGTPLPYAVEAGVPYYAENVLEELTAPGEWYLDRRTGDLYFWPPALPLTGNEVIVSTLDAPLVSFAGASYVTLQGITLEVTRSRLVTVDGASSNVTIDGCILRNAGTDGVLLDGHDDGILRSEISGTGGAGVILRGGERASLSPGRNYVRNTHVHDFARWEWTYKPAFDVGGVGNVVAHDHVHDAPHAAILFHGNNHVAEYNDIHDVVRVASDAGAIYAGLDAAARGNEIRYNFIHSIQSWFRAPARTGGGVFGVYLDECLSSAHVFANVFHSIQDGGIVMGGGRDNVMENNLFARIGQFALSSDDRCTNDAIFANVLPTYAGAPRRAPAWADYGGAIWAGSNNYARLAEIPAALTASTPPIAAGGVSIWRYPQGNVWARNLGWKIGAAGSGFERVSTHTDSSWKYYLEYGTPAYGDQPLSPCATRPTTNVVGQDPLFVDESALDLRLQPSSPVHSIPGWQPIPFEQIGIEPISVE